MGDKVDIKRQEGRGKKRWNNYGYAVSNYIKVSWFQKDFLMLSFGTKKNEIAGFLVKIRLVEMMTPKSHFEIDWPLATWF